VLDSTEEASIEVVHAPRGVGNQAAPNLSGPHRRRLAQVPEPDRRPADRDLVHPAHLGQRCVTSELGRAPVQGAVRHERIHGPRA